MSNNMIRKCGSSWAYCDGECTSCETNNTTTSNHSAQINIGSLCSNNVYIVGERKPNTDHFGVAGANRISEAVERTKQYIKE